MYHRIILRKPRLKINLSRRHTRKSARKFQHWKSYTLLYTLFYWFPSSSTKLKQTFGSNYVVFKRNSINCECWLWKNSGFFTTFIRNKNYKLENKRKRTYLQNYRVVVWPEENLSRVWLEKNLHTPCFMYHCSTFNYRIYLYNFL